MAVRRARRAAASRVIASSPDRRLDKRRRRIYQQVCFPNGMHKERRALRRHLMLKCSYSADARIVSISTNGCLIESRSTPKLDERVEFMAELRGRFVTLRGVVVHVRSGFEFAIRFAQLDEDAVSFVGAVARS